MNGTGGCRRRGVPCGVVALALAAAGCVELDLRIKVNEDGSATVTERVHFTEQVLDLASTLPVSEGLQILLKKERAMERVALMGPGARFVSHQVTDLPGGAKECVAVYQIPDVNDLRVCSPAVAWMDYEISPMTFVHGPHYTLGRDYNTGMMHLYTSTPRQARSWGPAGDRQGLKPAPSTASPADLQQYRDLLPVFKDLMQGFRLTCVIDCYAPVTWATGRRAREMTREYFVMLVNDENLDQYGGSILDNEEFMLALIRWDLRSPFITGVTQHSENNLTVPVYFPERGMSMRYIALRPSKFLFDKYFKGKPQFYGGDLEVPEPHNLRSREEQIKWGIIKEPPK